MSKKMSNGAIAFSDFAERQIENGLVRVQVSIWVKEKDAAKCRNAMKQAGEQYKQKTATLRNRDAG